MGICLNEYVNQAKMAENYVREISCQLINEEEVWQLAGVLDLMGINILHMNHMSVRCSDGEHQPTFHHS